ncbi:MAG: alpha/beta hydrolase family protein [Promethearchaeota archaeon]
MLNKNNLKKYRFLVISFILVLSNIGLFFIYKSPIIFTQSEYTIKVDALRVEQHTGKKESFSYNKTIIFHFPETYNNYDNTTNPRYPIAILIHGDFVDSNSMNLLISTLLRQNIIVVTQDFDFSPNTFFELNATLNFILNRSDIDYNKIAIIGHSHGAHYAFHFAWMRNDSISSTIILNYGTPLQIYEDYFNYFRIIANDSDAKKWNFNDFIRYYKFPFKINDSIGGNPRNVLFFIDELDPHEVYNKNYSNNIFLSNFMNIYNNPLYSSNENENYYLQIIQPLWELSKNDALYGDFAHQNARLISAHFSPFIHISGVFDPYAIYLTSSWLHSSFYEKDKESKYFNVNPLNSNYAYQNKLNIYSYCILALVLIALIISSAIYLLIIILQSIPKQYQFFVYRGSLLFNSISKYLAKIHVVVNLPIIEIKRNISDDMFKWPKNMIVPVNRDDHEQNLPVIKSKKAKRKLFNFNYYKNKFTTNLFSSYNKSLNFETLFRKVAENFIILFISGLFSLLIFAAIINPESPLIYLPPKLSNAFNNFVAFTSRLWNNLFMSPISFRFMYIWIPAFIFIRKGSIKDPFVLPGEINSKKDYIFTIIFTIELGTILALLSKYSFYLWTGFDSSIYIFNLILRLYIIYLCNYYVFIHIHKTIIRKDHFSDLLIINIILYLFVLYLPSVFPDTKSLLIYYSFFSIFFLPFIFILFITFLYITLKGEILKPTIISFFVLLAHILLIQSFVAIIF